MAQSSTDLWDISQGSIVTASSPPIPGYSVESMFGGFIGGDWSYFADGEPSGTVHFVEWETPANVTISQIHLWAFGDAMFGFPNNQREFQHFTLRAKSPGSPTYDLTLVDYEATHPYTFVGPFGFLIDEIIPAVTARQFRAEFLQYTAGLGFDGPRIVELDAFGPQPPVFTAGPQNGTVNIGMPALFEAAAEGTGAISYQWFKDGTPIVGQTSASFRIPAVTANDIGSYTVSATDSVGTTMSSPATLVIDFLNALQSNADVWDVRSGATITAHTEYHAAGTPEGMFGFGAPDPVAMLTYFADGMPTGTVHVVEWMIPNPAMLNSLRLFAYGDPGLNNGREFEQVTLKAKSPGSANFDVTLATFTPGHPYTFLDQAQALILDTRVTPVLSSAFRAEFLQFTAGNGFDGPRIVELDGFEGRPLLRPVIVTGPDSKTLPKNTQLTWKAVARGGDLTYQWKHNGQVIRDATTDTLFFKRVKLSDHGFYTVTVSNAAGTVESAQALLIVTQ
jgi:hypothetical protein